MAGTPIRKRMAAARMKCQASTQQRLGGVINTLRTFQARRVHIICIALPDLFIHEKSTFPTLVDFKIGKVAHLPSAGRTPWRCFTIYDLNQ
jgi:hypothetical protein